MHPIQFRLRIVVLSLVVMGAIAGFPRLAAAASGSHETLSFTVLRGGSPVGKYVVDIQGTPANATVKINTDVVVKIAFIPVYRFEQTSKEVWHNGRLAALSSVTNDDGDDHKLTVRRDAERLEVVGDDARHFLPSDLLPASLWNVDLVKAHRLLNTINGKAMAVSVVDVGEEQVDVHGQSRPAHHYSLKGDLARDLWYDRDGTLVRVSFAAKDDSHIDYVLE